MSWDPQTSDAELVQAWHRGDKTAADVLIRRHGPRLYNFFAGKVGRGADALCQATLHDGLTAAEPPAEDGDRDSFRARLFAAARRRLLDGYRTGEREGQPLDPHERSMADLEPGLSEAVAAREDQRRLALALRRLPVDLQIALELHHWEGLTVAELGRVLAAPAADIEARLAHAHERLQEQLAREDGYIEPTVDGSSADEPRSG